MGVARAWLPQVAVTIGAIFIVFASFDVWYSYHTFTTCLPVDCSVIQNTGDESRVVAPFGDGYLTATLGLAILAAAWSSLLFSNQRSIFSSVASLGSLAVMTVAAVAAFDSNVIQWRNRDLGGDPTTTVWAMVALGALVAVTAATGVKANDLRSWIRSPWVGALLDRALPGRPIKPPR